MTRRKREEILIGDDIRIVITDIRGDKVRVAIDAPKTLAVHRREIYDLIQKEKTVESA